ncbi:MAG: ComEC/Rec2 family competence protein [Nocardioidaceae bacterium]|nr:ComEC/Rec2 family competence protein [Nocardioidaceae bacterium]
MTSAGSSPASSPEPSPGSSPARDLRTPLLAATAWGAALLGQTLPGARPWLVLLALTALGLTRRRLRTPLGAGLLLVAGTALLVGQVRIDEVRLSPVAELARDGATIRAELTVASAPELRHGRFGDVVRFEATTRSVQGRGRRTASPARVLVLLDLDDGWASRQAGLRSGVEVGARIRVQGRLRPADEPDLAGVLLARGRPQVLAGPGPFARASTSARAAVRRASSDLGDGAAALVPALVDGDESAAGGTEPFTPAFRTAGMTHLLAVSGTNLTLILGAVLLLARWCRVRSWGLAVAGALGVAGFVLLAGPEPSVLRAAAMGTVALAGMGRAGAGRGTRTLGVAVLLLVLADPWLARSVGFALSVAATAGILVLGPPWRDALARWLPRWLAEAVAVPLAAQVACTPVVAAISGQVSLVAVGANIVAAPLVGPATVLGLAGGLVALVSTQAGQLVALPAGWCAHGIIAVAERAAAMPVPALPWSTAPLALALLTLVCLVVALGLASVLVRPGLTVGLVLAVVVVVRAPLPLGSWPPAGWVMVACDVGQGDALVLRVAEHSAVVVDAGPDPALVDDCLRRLEIRSVPVLVISHFHADHVDGVDGVMRGRRVGRLDVSPLAEPPAGAREVERAAERARVPVRQVRLGERTEVGDLRWQVLGPVRTPVPDSGSPPNDASVVLLVETRGVRLLLMGDEEQPSQRDLDRAWPGLRADVLKVAHHGSRNQDEHLVDGLGARVALISVGVDNDYGHPAPRTLDLLTRARMRVLRTDRDGDLAVVVEPGGGLATRGRGKPP